MEYFKRISRTYILILDEIEKIPSKINKFDFGKIKIKFKFNKYWI